ncbi:MAG TPA: WXG100 family type VII secretion target [Ktedonobacteraceae bacterium]|nr:WXG100 family type VII secretion target [Ktedonobacteraceae bacterium]
MSGNGDMIGASTGEMDATAQNFLQRLQEFETAMQNITHAVSNLEAKWYGRGSVAFQGAMDKWHKDAQAIHDDLQQLTNGLHLSRQSLQDLDNQMAKAFDGF